MNLYLAQRVKHELTRRYPRKKRPPNTGGPVTLGSDVGSAFSDARDDRGLQAQTGSESFTVRDLLLENEARGWRAGEHQNSERMALRDEGRRLNCDAQQR